MTARWLLPAGDAGKPVWTVHHQDSGPLAELDLGPGAPLLQFRCLPDLDDLAGAVAGMAAAFGEALARHEDRPLVDHRPASMLQPVTFDDSTAGDELRTVALQPVDETADSWEPLPDLPHREPGEALDELTALRAGYAAGHARAREELYAADDDLPHREPGDALDALMAAHRDGCPTIGHAPSPQYRCTCTESDQPQPGGTIYAALSPEALAGEKPLESLAAEPDAAE